MPHMRPSRALASTDPTLPHLHPRPCLRHRETAWLQKRWCCATHLHPPSWCTVGRSTRPVLAVLASQPSPTKLLLTGHQVGVRQRQPAMARARTVHPPASALVRPTTRGGPRRTAARPRDQGPRWSASLSSAGWMQRQLPWWGWGRHALEQLAGGEGGEGARPAGSLPPAWTQLARACAAQQLRPLPPAECCCCPARAAWCAPHVCVHAWACTRTVLHMSGCEAHTSPSPSQACPHGCTDSVHVPHCLACER